MTKLDLTLREVPHMNEEYGLRATYIGDICCVSTIRLRGRDEWETLVYGGPWSDRQEQYLTEEGAISGHDYVVNDIVSSLEMGYIPNEKRIVMSFDGWEMSDYSGYVAIKVGDVTVTINRNDGFVLVSTYHNYGADNEKTVGQVFVNTTG
jgi:hypothetical protein